MDVAKEYLDPTILNEGYTLSHLWSLREKLFRICENTERGHLLSIKLGKVIDATNFGKDLHFIRRNIELIEYVMEEKQFEIFEYTEYGDIGLN